MQLRFFIDRPVFSIVLSVILVLMGVVAVVNLPVEQYPDMAPPTISVSTSYPGANAETVQKSVIVPLEEAINGVEHMSYIISSASNSGEASIDVYFKQGSNADMDAVNVQNRVSTALSLLPAEVTKIGVTTEKQQNSELKTFALYCDNGKYDEKFLNNYMDINVIPRLKRIGGVGKVMQFGSSYSMRIWMKPDKMAQYKLIPSDLSQALEKQNIEAATGAFGENHDNTYQYTMKYRGRFSTPEEFGNIVIRALSDGNVLRLRDVANVEMGSEAYNFSTAVDDKPAAMAMITQTAGSNASKIIREIDSALQEMSSSLPDGTQFVTLSDTNKFLYASIQEVIKTLLVAILLVILVVYLFLQDLRSTIIPTLSIIVSIVGTFAFISLIGFSINLLTLFALVLAIGTVVDDAIIVVEAVQARFDSGYRSPFKAALDAMSGISSAILTSTFIFMAVFIPVSMIGGTSGTFYKQFGITMAIAVGISAFNAFTLSPALCALLLRPYTDEDGQIKANFAARCRIAFNAAFFVLTQRYVKSLVFFSRYRKTMWCMLAAALILLVLMMWSTKTGLVPDEDTGTINVSMNCKPGTSLMQTEKVASQVGHYLSSIPEIDHFGKVTGYSLTGSGPSMGMFFISLKDWNQRNSKSQSADEIMNRITGFSSEVKDAQFYVTKPPMIPGYGMQSGFELYLQDRASGSTQSFKKVSDSFIQALQKRPEINNIYSTFDTKYPQYWVDIDAAKCEQAGISPSEILETIASYYGGEYVSNFNRFSKLYRVSIQADPSYRVSPASISQIYVRAGGNMAPISQFVHLTKTYGSQELSRFNLYNAIAIDGEPAPGYSSGDALRAINETAQQMLPKNYGYEFGGVSREESQSSNNVAVIFTLCLVLVYLILSALYESFLLPFAIILAVPCGLLGSFVFARIFGLENNIYMQTGLIMLIGLLSKTSVLLTEYAVVRRKAGMSLMQAAYSAAKVRFRPILMTVLAMVFGLLPLMIASGVGANGSRSLASTVVGGLLFGTIALLIFVPLLFIFFQYLQEKYGNFHPV